MPPEAPRVALDADGEARARLVAALGAAPVERDAAEALVRDFADDAALARAIERGFDGPPVVALVDDPGGALALGALRAGAAAILARDVRARELRAAVAAAALGLAVLGDEARSALARPPETSAEALTPRERDVLELIAHGLSNHRIAERLSISDHTVKAHVGAILAKLGVTTRAEAVAAGARLGIVML